MTLRSRAATACLIAATLALATACASDNPRYPDATVVVDVFSGRENPVVALDGDVAQELFDYLDKRADDVYPTPGALPQLGFNGLVVTLVDAESATSTIRVMPHAIYVYDPMGTVRISDLTGAAFDIVWPAVKPELDQATVEAIEEAN
jgi:hypothetical protein